MAETALLRRDEAVTALGAVRAADTRFALDIIYRTDLEAAREVVAGLPIPMLANLVAQDASQPDSGHVLALVEPARVPDVILADPRVVDPMRPSSYIPIDAETARRLRSRSGRDFLGRSGRLRSHAKVVRADDFHGPTPAPGDHQVYWFMSTREATIDIEALYERVHAILSADREEAWKRETLNSLGIDLLALACRCDSIHDGESTLNDRLARIDESLAGNVRRIVHVDIEDLQERALDAWEELMEREGLLVLPDDSSEVPRSSEASVADLLEDLSR